MVRVYFFFFFFFSYAKGGGIRVGDFIEIIIVGRKLRKAKRRREKQRKQHLFVVFHRNNTNES